MSSTSIQIGGRFIHLKFHLSTITTVHKVINKSTMMKGLFFQLLNIFSTNGITPGSGLKGILAKALTQVILLGSI